ncbi:MAG: cation:proton antiporter [Actinomycetota bacterium]
MTGVAILSGVFVLYALMASRLDRLSISAPMVFVFTGVILGSGVTDLIDISLTSEPVLLVVEVTLALLLFADASTIRLREVEDDARLPSRLLLIGLPLTIAFGTVIGALLFPAAGWAAAALIGSILAPTDAALGLAIFTNPEVPSRIRRALNVESGLNDGIATPFVALFLTVLVSEEAGSAGDWLLEAGKEIGLGLIVAVGLGLIGARLFRAAQQHGSISGVSEQLGIVSLALLAYFGSVAIGGNGFIAAFVGGLTFGTSTQGSLRQPTEFTETLGLFLSFFVWSVFGAIFVGPVLTARLGAAAIVYAVLSLTLVRMVPVAISLVGTRLRFDTVALMGWFGPRGLASVVFTLVAVEAIHESGAAFDAIVEVATWTILLSVLAHGLTAGPLSRAYGRRIQGAGDVPELSDVPEPRIRRRKIGTA